MSGDVHVHTHMGASGDKEKRKKKEKRKRGMRGQQKGLDLPALFVSRLFFPFT